MTDTIPDDVAAGQALYTPWTLRAYDLAMAINCGLYFGCPRSRMLEQFDRHLSADHLDLGVGTGYFLDHCRKPAADQRITLADLNENSLAHAARRLARYTPTTVRANALEPLPFAADTFGSASTNCMLHCLPGDIPAKAPVLDHLATVVRPGGTIFGSTVLAQGVPVRPHARLFFRALNRSGVFQNAQDHLEDLRIALDDRFSEYTLTVRGCVGLFVATVD